MWIDFILRIIPLGINEKEMGQSEAEKKEMFREALLQA
jgi:hypothetical protein